MRWKYKLTNRRLSLMPSSARPNRVELPRSRASWPSAESKMSETMKSTNPITFVQRSWYANRWPATSPITSDHSVTWSAEIPVGCSARAIRMPMGRKKWRSAHSSTACPLCDKSFCSFTEHFLHSGDGAHRLVLVDHQGRIDAHFRVIDHREHAAREQRVEDPACDLLVEQPAGPGDDEIHPDHQAAPPHVRHDRERAQLVRKLAQQLQVARRRTHVPRRALDRLDDDRRHVPRRLELDLVPQEVHAMPLARRERLVESAARARRIG